jgi:DNA-binding FadR family transcriptional regulator
MPSLSLDNFDTPLERTRIFEQIAEQINTQIRTGQLRPHDRLPSERELAAAFGVSRTIIREALKLLEARGLLQTRIGNGVFVREADPRAVTEAFEIFLHLRYAPDEDVQEIDQLRRILEGGIVAAAADRATDEDIAGLHALLRAMEQADALPDHAADLDLKFHLALAEATHNRMLSLVLDPIISHLRAHFQTVWTRYDRPTRLIHNQHRAIVAAIELRDPLGARAAMDAHLTYAHEIIESHFNRPTTGDKPQTSGASV